MKKAKTIPNLVWSSWKKDGIFDSYFSFLGDWRGLTHPHHHNAVVWRFWDKNLERTMYEAYVECGAFGETQYLRETFKTATGARLAVELAVVEALSHNDLSMSQEQLLDGIHYLSS
jgi:hypothetical protein